MKDQYLMFCKEGYGVKRTELEEHIANMFKDGTIKLQAHLFGTSGIYINVTVNDEVVLEWDNVE